ncbi:TonB-dependent receptor plug domain-containing protein [Necropsobacter massiliensis]|uniref:TonB-dependent receptor plug domain-containing protein n=1 Tax=Necropsobacter massiliensis TaxID=1400001 RepID=UPI000595F030|nr:TonB-dependent receptor plug domain-containing protein [Necropsobacter massiliensis]
MFNYNKNLLAVVIGSVFSAGLSAAESSNGDTQHKLAEIVVYAEQNRSLSSVQSINREEMRKTPATNGNISDYLAANPHVRYENSDKDGFLRGEIKPENISINGADFNQTAYFVDNVNINNDLTVDSEIFDGSVQTVPGLSSTQAYFFDATMLSKVELHDSNISASLGGFTGGAVVAKTKQYDGHNRIGLKYRTTDSSWARMKTDDSLRKTLAQVRPDDSGAAIFQPKYGKQFFSLTAEQGLTDNLGMVFGFSRRISRIEQNRLIRPEKDKPVQLDKENHSRLADTALLNLNYTPNDNNRFELGFRYSGYKESKYYRDNIGNNVDDYHNAYGMTLSWVRAFESGVLTNTLAYDQFFDKRKSSSNSVENISVLDDNYDLLYSYEKGGWGDSELAQRNLHFSTEYAVNPFNWGNVSHSISVGGIYQRTSYRFHRPNAVKTKIIDIYPDSTSSLLHEEIVPAGSVNTNYQNIVVYAEDLITWRNIELRPGIRAERDDYLKNNNIAPRFVARYSPWQETKFSLGLNRYYGRSFSSLKLTNEILRLNNDSSRQHQAFGALKTPYADELSLGFEQHLANWALKLNYIHRKNKNRIVLRRENRKTVYHNGNDFGVDVYALQLNNIEPWQWGNSYWNASLGFDWLTTKRADLDKDLNPDERVYLDGKAMTRRQMEQKVNSSSEDWIVRAGLDMSIPDYAITWSNRLYVKAPIRGYEQISSNAEEISRYRSFDYGTHYQWDSSVRWQLPISGTHSAYIQLDVLNVLNNVRQKSSKSISASDEYGIYSAGREFWLELGYNF